MNEIELIPAGFSLCWLAYYVRGVLRIHSARGTNSFWETWLRFWLSPAILKDSFRCAVISLGVFLGIEIARGYDPEEGIDKDSEKDRF